MYVTMTLVTTVTKQACSATLQGRTVVLAMDKGAGTSQMERKSQIQKLMEDWLALLLAEQRGKCACTESTLIAVHYHRQGAFTA